MVQKYNGGGSVYRRKTTTRAPVSGPHGGGGPSRPEPSKPSGGGGPHRDQGDIDRERREKSLAYRNKKAAEKVQKQAVDTATRKEKDGKGIISQAIDKAKPALQKFLYGQEAAPGVTKEQFEKEGQHKLRSQFDYLSKKYGEGFADTSQGKLLRDYLSGVPVERGGGLGAQDRTYGEGGEEIDINAPGETYRRGLLNQIASGRYGFGDINIDDALAGQGLSPDQYFNFRQQLMAADPSVGNVAYKKAFPFASGQLAQGVMSLAPGMGPLKAIAKGVAGAIPSEVKQEGRKLRAALGEAFDPITSKIKPALTDLRKDIGGPFKDFGNWFKFNPPAEAYGNIGRPFGAAPSVRPDIDRGGVIDAAQSVVDQQSPYGGWIGRDESQMYTGDVIDSDRDGVDDRWQTGPGAPNMNPALGGDSKLPGFEVGQPGIFPMPGFPHPITLPSVYPKTDIAASQAAGYDIPIGGGQDPNLQDWYKNLGIMQNVYS